jgi:hypothetical protein
MWADRIIGIPAPNSNWVDYAAYCQKQGGQFLGNLQRTRYCGTKHICLKTEYLSATGDAYGINLYEARQNARKSCVSRMPADSNACEVGTYHYFNAYVAFGEFNCK